MRLGQLARKYDIPVQDIITYLEEEFNSREHFHPNSKLDEAMEEQVFQHFDIVLPTEEVPEPVETGEIEPEEQVSEVEEEVLPEPEPMEELPASPLEDIASVGGEVAEMPLEPVIDSEKASEVEEKEEETIATQVNEDEVIQTDKLLELLESEEPPADLEKIKLIKAPKKELSGLKVLGKVDLPEPKKREEKLEENTQKQTKRPKLSDEEQEKRRLKAKRKQEAFEARKEKRRKEQEKQKRKARNEAHYKQQLQHTQERKVKEKAKSETPPIQEQKSEPPKPKTLLGKFWRWMNT